MFRTALLILATFSATILPAQQPSQQEIDGFLTSDADQNGVLDRGEFKTFVRFMAGQNQPTAQTIVLFRAFGFAFSQVDKDRDGFASPDELRRADTTFQQDQN